MKIVERALLLSFIARRRFTIWTNSVLRIGAKTESILKQQCQFEDHQIANIDLLDFLLDVDPLASISTELMERIINVEKDGLRTFKNVIILRGMQRLSASSQKCLYEFISMIDQFDTNESQGNCTVKFNDYVIQKPELFVIIPILDDKLYHDKLLQYLKEKFWFCIHQKVNVDEEIAPNFQSWSMPLAHSSYEENVIFLRDQALKVHVAPDIKRYIYSLVVHSRNHRLTSLAPLQSRLLTRAIDEIRDLCVALVAVQNYNTDELFVTPDHVKVAMRKVGYWLCDWECNPLFTPPSKPQKHQGFDESVEYQKRMEIKMLTGDWYGSDYTYVERYIEKMRSVKDENSPTGYTNQVIEDVIAKVHPPI